MVVITLPIAGIYSSESGRPRTAGRCRANDSAIACVVLGIRSVDIDHPPHMLRMVRTVITPRAQLADQLKQARLDAGYKSQQALAKKLHMNRTVVTKAESPNQPVPTDALLAAWAEATGTDPEALADLANRAKSSSPDWFMPYLTAESAATVLRCFGIVTLPGILQTELYARAVLSVYPHPPEKLAALIKTRMERKQVLDRGAYLVAAISTRALQVGVGGPEIMAEQCSQLVAMAGRPNIALHVVPEDANTGVWAGLEIASRGSSTTVCLTTALDDVTSTASDQIDGATQAFERILGCAMTTGDSLDFLRNMEGHWKQQL